MTPTQAATAAPLYVQMTAINQAILDIQGAVSAGAQIDAITVDLNGGPKARISLTQPLDAPSSAALLTQTETLMQSWITALTAALAAV